MTKQEVIELTGQSVYLIWVQMAMQVYEPLDPQASFETASDFIRELLRQEPEF